MEQDSTQVRTAIYTRKSVVKEDKDAESIEVQTHHCKKRAELNRWTVVREFSDSGISASKGLTRPGFLELIEYIKTKRVDAVLVRDQARISREEIELFIFLKEAEKAGVEIQDSNGNNIKNDLSSKIRGIVDADYAKQVGKNVRSKRQAQAERGDPPYSKHRPYGYESGYTAIIPHEAKILKEMANRLLAGESLYGIAKELNERGDLKYYGGKWTSQDISKLLAKPEYAALRTFNGEVVAPGKWKPIFTRDLHEKIRQALNENKPFSRNTARKHLLSSVLVCNECGKPLSGKAPSYYCNKTRGGCGKIVRNMKALDEFFIQLTHKAIAQLPSVEQKEIEDYTSQEIERLEAKIEEARTAYKAEAISLADFVDIRSDADEKIRELRKKQVKAVKLPVEDSEAFLKASVDKQRATIKRLFPVVGVKPTGAKGTRFHPDQLVFPN